MQFGYMTTKSAATSIRKQITAMRAAGFDMDDPHERVFKDDRDFAITALTPGDELVVATAACLGTVASDVLGILRAVAERGAVIRVLDDDVLLSFTPETQAALDVAMKADHENRKASIAKMRKARAESGNLGGIPPVEWGPKQAKMLKDMLADGVSRQDMAKRLKVSVSTLQRKLRELRAASR